jgi:hypothetical protein
MNISVNTQVTGLQLVYEEAVRHNPQVIEHVPDQTERLCLIAIDLDPSTIKFVKNKTPQIVKKTVEKNPYYIMDVDEQTDELCILAINRSGKRDIMNFIKNPSHDMLKAMLSIDGDYLEKIDNPTAELCNTAVLQNGLSLRFVETNMKSYKICNDAVNTNVLSIKYVNRANLYENIIKYALKKNGVTLQFIPQDLQTEKLCKIAINSNWESLKFVKNQTDEIVDFAINLNPASSQYAEKLSEKAMMKLISQDKFPSSFKYPTKMVLWEYINKFFRGVTINDFPKNVNPEIMEAYLGRILARGCSIANVNNFITKMDSRVDNLVYHWMVYKRCDQSLRFKSDMQYMYSLLTGIYNETKPRRYGYRHRAYITCNVLPTADEVRNGKAILMLLEKNINV